MNLKEHLDSVNESITITRAVNGWVFEANGRKDDEWKNVRVLVNTSDTLMSLITDHNEMKID